MAAYHEEKSRGGAFALLFGVSSLGARLHQHCLGTLSLAGTGWSAGEGSCFEQGYIRLPGCDC